ncbi:unnamed protein product [Dovyalis caffra]|uniref:tRNA-binding domain-containing protein n=1 Tax=Dovyalis caffra TaxID=77055 RepID=A0AAV1RUD7_9ROSI|nr:unnamed protein product [Dovyalis caffra]
MSLQRKQIIASALSKYLSVSPEASLGDVGEYDIKSLYLNILKSSGKGSPSKESEEVMKWISFAETFPVDSLACFDALNGLNEDLALKSVVLGNGLTPSEADIIGLSHLEKEKLVHVMRWMDYIQNKVDFGKLFEKILLEKAAFELQGIKGAAKSEVDTNAKKTVEYTKNKEKSEADPRQQSNPNFKLTSLATRAKLSWLKVEEGLFPFTAFSAKISSNICDIVVLYWSLLNSGGIEVGPEKISLEMALAFNNKATGKKESTQEKKKPSDKEAAEKDKELSVSLLNIQVGLIRKAWKHPSADSLLVEEIDVGDAKLRQVVSGLAKYFSPDELTNRRVALITNVKPGKLRDVMSEGLVLCASNEDHTMVEPLLPPEGAKVGERVSFLGIDGKPEDVLNPKKKQLEKITPQCFRMLIFDLVAWSKIHEIPHWVGATRQSEEDLVERILIDIDTDTDSVRD